MSAFDQRTVSARNVADLQAAEEAAHAMLTALGVPLDLPGLERTPQRMVTALAEMTTPEPFEPTTFEKVEGYESLVIVRDVAFTAVCEHHFLAFTGTATVAYLPSDRIVGLSKLARIVTYVSRGPQVQERMTVQIANWVEQTLNPVGIGVILSATHTCMTLRGARSAGSTTVTSALRGRLRTDASARAEFMALAGVQ